MGKITTVSFKILLSISFFLCSGHVLIVFFFRHEHFTSYELSAGGYPRFPWHETIGSNTYLTDWVTCHLSILSTPPYQVFFRGLLDTFS